MLADLAARGLDPTQAMAARVFDGFGPAGSKTTVVADRDLILVVAAPAGRVLDGAPPASDLLVEVRRTAPRDPRGDGASRAAGRATAWTSASIGRPLARTRSSEGEFIQVIDVEGRQCSDFLAFHRHKLDEGIERGLDATVTRTLMGNAYPTPGLTGKFYDADMEPLVEVVRDTVGRHDTFALACNSKYYEDMGYFGHLNCTDNFNVQIAARTRSPPARAGPRSTCSSTRASRRTTSWSATNRGRAPATTC